MPKKEPLTRAKKSPYFGRPTGETELTSRAKSKLQGQIQKADEIVRAEQKAGRSDSKALQQAKKIRNRAQKLLGGPSKKTTTAKKAVSPDKKASTSSGDKYKKRRAPFEKATGTGRIKEALIGVAKRAQRANGG